LSKKQYGNSKSSSNESSRRINNEEYDKFTKIGTCNHISKALGTPNPIEEIIESSQSWCSSLD
jgi:selenocysteine lyase/cysteine desulfurase